MSYENFTKQVLFADQSANVLCNRLYNDLEGQFVKGTLDTRFCITGTLAKILNGAAASDIKVVPFITSDDAIYSYCAKSLPKRINAQAMVFKDRVQLIYKTFYIEIWKATNLGTINAVNGFLVQDNADIPTHIL